MDRGGSEEGDCGADTVHRNIRRCDDRRETAGGGHLAATRKRDERGGDTRHEAHLDHGLAIPQGDAIDDGFGDAAQQGRNERRKRNGLELRALRLEKHTGRSAGRSKDGG